MKMDKVKYLKAVNSKMLQLKRKLFSHVNLKSQVGKFNFVGALKIKII